MTLPPGLEVEWDAQDIRRLQEERDKYRRKYETAEARMDPLVYDVRNLLDAMRAQGGSVTQASEAVWTWYAALRNEFSGW